MKTTLVIFSKSAINTYQTLWDALINILYPLSFTQLFVLVLLKVQLTSKGLSAIRVFMKLYSC